MSLWDIKINNIEYKFPNLIAFSGILLSIIFSFKGTQYFNREIYTILFFGLFYYIIINYKYIKLTFYQITFISIASLFAFIDLYLERGSRTTSFINIVIFGYLYYFIAPINNPTYIYQNFVYLLKILISLMVIEQVLLFFNLIDVEEIKSYIPFFSIYTSKFIEVTNLGYEAAQSIYLGPQIGSMIVAYGIVVFFPYAESDFSVWNRSIWFYLTLIIFLYIFTFTSILMLVCWFLFAFINYKKSRFRITLLAISFLLVVIYISINFFTSTVKLVYDKTQIEIYINTFTDLIINFFQQEWEYILFGLPKGLDTSYISNFHEFGFGIIMAMLGITFIAFIILSYMLILYGSLGEKYNIHRQHSIILLTLILISLSHYLVVLKTGPALLFSLIIYYYLLSVNNKNI